MANNNAEQSGSAGEPLASAEPWNLVADNYTKDLVPWAEHFARQALQLADLPPSPHIVDVACGPGTLSLVAARQGAAVSAIDFSPEMIANFKRRANEAGLKIADMRVGDGQDLPFENDSFDGAFSLVGLIFFPDRSAGFREMRRVLKPERRAVISSIAQLPEQAAMVFGAVSGMLPGLLNAAGKAPLSEPDDFTAEMSAVGFRDVRIHTMSHTVDNPSVAAYWHKTERSSAPLVLLRRRLGDKQWAEISAGVENKLRKALGEGPVSEKFEINLGVGIK